MRLMDFLNALREARTNEVVVTAMASAREWALLSDHPLDFNYAPSSMGQATALGLGIALARPERRVVVINGDGCLLMNLGSLVTIAQQNPANLTLFNIENGVYEVTGGQPVAGAGKVAFAELARGAGWRAVHEFSAIGPLQQSLKSLFLSPGPIFVNLKVVPEPGTAPKAKRPIFETIEILTAALAEH